MVAGLRSGGGFRVYMVVSSGLLNIQFPLFEQLENVSIFVYVRNLLAGFPEE